MRTKIFAVLVMLLTIGLCDIPADLMAQVPGYPEHFSGKVYSGSLNTSSQSRKLHYVFIESTKGPGNKDPLTLWLNGGPGCSSLLGFLTQIGPYYIEEGANYSKGDNLTENPYSWHKQSNLLFIQSPAGVGYSINTDPTNFTYNDLTTANDNIDALHSFFAGYPEYTDNNFWLAGQSYAGKYIPDLATLIDFYNAGGSGKKINLKGLLIGNGVMSFENGELEKSQIEYMINHEFIDPELLSYYNNACQYDSLSAGCQYFKLRFSENVDQINPYNVYSYCYYNDSFMGQNKQQKKVFHNQGSILKQFARKGKFEHQQGFNGAPCAYFDGMYQYFNIHASEFHAIGKTWNGPCSQDISLKYSIDVHGSMSEYRYLLGKINDYHFVLYSGDWDDIVPYTDTLKNLNKLNLEESYIYTPFFANDQHAGFTQVFSGVVFHLMKGASHQVPQSKRAEAYELFKMSLEAHNNKKSDEI